MKSAERFRHFIPHPDLCFVNELALKVLARYYILGNIQGQPLINIGNSEIIR